MNGHNPLLPPQWCFPDCEAHVWDDRLYLYGSWDQEHTHFCSREYGVASTEDLLSWQITAPSFHAELASWATVSAAHSSVHNEKSFDELPEHIRNLLPEGARKIPIQQIIAAIEAQTEKGLSKEVLLFAPDAVKYEDRYYLYFCLSDDSEGVAVSDSPSGPFQNASQLRMKDSRQEITGIDPAVFLDDDGKCYYYWGQFQSNGAVLCESMAEVDDSTLVTGILTEKEHHFHEGSSIRKRNGIYYYIFADSSRGKPTCLGYATATAPLGPYTYRGVIIDNRNCDPGCWNNHGSIEEFRGNWYVFYHRSCGNSQYMRRVCAEPIRFDENGLITEVKMTSQGMGKPFGAGDRIPGFSACEVSGTAYTELDCLTVQSGTGSAVWRWFENNAPLTRLECDSTGTGSVTVFSDGSSIGTGRLGEMIPIFLPTGKHEITLRIEAEETVQINAVKLDKGCA